MNTVQDYRYFGFQVSLHTELGHSKQNLWISQSACLFCDYQKCHGTACCEDKTPVLEIWLCVQRQTWQWHKIVCWKETGYVSVRDRNCLEQITKQTLLYLINFKKKCRLHCWLVTMQWNKKCYKNVREKDNVCENWHGKVVLAQSTLHHLII